MSFQGAIMDPTPGAQFYRIYEDLLWRVLHRGHLETNERTGHTVRSWTPVSFSLDLGDGWLPVAGNRRLYPATAAAEVAWMLMGTQDASFMMRHAKVVWEKFVETIPVLTGDGLVSSEFEGVQAAYGYRWRRHFGRDQLKLAVEALRKNPSDRRVWISAWDPSSDGLGARGQLNVPCPVGFGFSVVDGRLHSSLVLRSSDIFVGLPYDVQGHAMLMAIVAATLRLPLGVMHFTLAHPHLYDSHFEFAEQSFHHFVRRTKVALVQHPLDAVEAEPDMFVALYKARAQDEPWPDFAPRPAVIP